MNKHYLIFFLALLVQCMGQETEILPNDIVGEWVRVIDVQQPSGYEYVKDTVLYCIGMQKIRDSVPYNVYDTLSFLAEGIYKDNCIDGFLYRSWDMYGKNEYDYDRNVPFIRFTLRIRKNGAYEEREAKFSYARDFSTDTIVVSIGESEPFGLKRKGL